MTKIKILDNLTVQKIAAGEVIENPASIVKELVENSIDAKADNIVIEIKNGGKDYIRITDNGEGMSRQDLNIAFKRHSTSKLEDIEDIYNIISLGFRGEALSSISNVAKIEVLTKSDDSSPGVNAFVQEGEITSIDNVGCPKGTTMIVRDLFYNLPVRKKFLRSKRAESNSISDIINKLALGNKHISFRFIRDNKTILQTNKTIDLLNTIYTVLGKEFSDNFIAINYQDDYIRVNGFISNNKLYRGNRSHQYLYVNKRSIENLTISKVIEGKYKSLIPLNKFPTFVLNIDINPGEIDINMHPTKQEIKFVNRDKVVKKLSKIIDGSLYQAVEIPNLDFQNKKKDKRVKEKEKLPRLFQLNHGSEDKDNIKDFIVRDFTGASQSKKSIGKNKRRKSYSYPTRNKFNDLKATKPSNLSTTDKVKDKKTISPEKTIKEKGIRDYLLDISPIGRIFNTYILAESKKDEKLFIIDQHAAHERIMYERYQEEYKNEEIITQQLISPNIIELTSAEMYKFEGHIGFFKDLGFDLEKFGPNSIALRGIPLIFGAPEGKSLFMDILDNLDQDIKSSYDIKLDKIMKIACSNSIKSGDKINSQEIIGLFRDLKNCTNPFTCPHGRPTMVELTKKDIEKEFLRIQ